MIGVYHIHMDEFVVKQQACPYLFGKGIWTSVYSFHLRSPTPSTRNAVAQHQAAGGQFSPDRIAELLMKSIDDDDDDDDELKEIPVKKILKQNNLFHFFRNKIVVPPEEKIRQFELLKELQVQVEIQANLYSPRSRWMDAFPVKCKSSTPCRTCRECSIRAAQAAMVCVAAHGTADHNILAPLGAVFRHPWYKNYTIEDWVATDLTEIATIFEPCSKQSMNAHYFWMFMCYCAKKGVPTSVEELSGLYGFQKKNSSFVPTRIPGSDSWNSSRQASWTCICEPRLGPQGNAPRVNASACGKVVANSLSYQGE